MNNKGFTLVEILAVVVILGILVGIAVPFYTGYLVNSRLETFETNEHSMETAAEDFLLINGLFDQISEYGYITLETLVSNGHIDDIIDPDKHGSLCDYDDSYVIVKKINNVDFDYEAYLFCSAYETTVSDENLLANDTTVFITK